MAPGSDRGKGDFLQQQETSHKTSGFAAWAWPTKHRMLLFVIHPNSDTGCLKRAPVFFPLDTACPCLV